MSIRFAKNETVVRRFDYATLGYRKKTDSYAVSRSLIVTNKRVIHQDVSEQAGRDLIVRREMPIDHAKFVDVRYTKTSKPSCLIAALILAILSAAVYLFGDLRAEIPNAAFLQKIPAFVFLGIAGVLGLIALVNLINYFTSFRVYLACTVSTDGMIQPVFSNTITDAAISPKKAKQANKTTLRMEIDIRINKQAAKDLADGLGAAILDAVEMNRVAEQTMSAACCASETEGGAEQTVEQTAEQVADEALEESTEEVAQDSAEEATEENVEEPVGETIEEDVEEAAEEDVAQTEESTDEAAEESDEQTTDEPTDENAPAQN